jgi:hypothetical protein
MHALAAALRADAGAGLAERAFADSLALDDARGSAQTADNHDASKPPPRMALWVSLCAALRAVLGAKLPAAERRGALALAGQLAIRCGFGALGGGAPLTRLVAGLARVEGAVELERAPAERDTEALTAAFRCVEALVAHLSAMSGSDPSGEEQPSAASGPAAVPPQQPQSPGDDAAFDTAALEHLRATLLDIFGDVVAFLRDVQESSVLPGATGDPLAPAASRLVLAWLREESAAMRREIAGVLPVICETALVVDPTGLGPLLVRALPAMLESRAMHVALVGDARAPALLARYTAESIADGSRWLAVAPPPSSPPTQHARAQPKSWRDADAAAEALDAVRAVAEMMDPRFPVDAALLLDALPALRLAAAATMPPARPPHGRAAHGVVFDGAGGGGGGGGGGRGGSNRAPRAVDEDDIDAELGGGAAAPASSCIRALRLFAATAGFLIIDSGAAGLDDAELAHWRGIIESTAHSIAEGGGVVAGEDPDLLTDGLATARAALRRGKAGDQNDTAQDHQDAHAISKDRQSPLAAIEAALAVL